MVRRVFWVHETAGSIPVTSTMRINRNTIETSVKRWTDLLLPGLHGYADASKTSCSLVARRLLREQEIRCSIHRSSTVNKRGVRGTGSFYMAAV